MWLLEMFIPTKRRGLDTLAKKEMCAILLVCLSHGKQKTTGFIFHTHNSSARRNLLMPHNHSVCESPWLRWELCVAHICTPSSLAPSPSAKLIGQRLDLSCLTAGKYSNVD